MPRSTSFIALLPIFLGTQACLAQQATEEDFQAWRDARLGRWVGDVTWVADWPGFGTKGDKVTGYALMRTAADGNLIVGEFLGGDGTNHWITFYDAGARQIRSVGGDSGGTTWSCVISRPGEGWESQCTGSLADGTKTEGEYTLAISDMGNTHRWTGPTTIGGEPVDPLNDVWTRVGK